MQAKHEPREVFVEQLELRIASEARRRNGFRPPVHWLLRSPARLAVAIVAIVMVSMAAGGAVVDATYRSQKNERRDRILAVYETRLQLALAQLQNAAAEADRLKRNVSIGLASNRDLFESQLRVKEAEAEVTKSRLDVEEIRITGDEPVINLTAPVVQGRDFVSERWMAEIDVALHALDMERRNQQDAQRRFSIGVGNASDVEAASARSTQLEATLNWFRQRIDIRKRFVRKEIDATEAQLIELEAETFMRFLTLRSQLDMAKRDLASAEIRVKKGLSDTVDVAKARLAVMRLEADVAKVQLERELIQKRRRGKN